MAEEIRLEAQSRDKVGKKVEEARKEHLVPAIVYGHGIENRTIFVQELDFTRVLRAAGENTLVSLSIDGGQPSNTLIAESQKDPVTGRVLHVDFFQVRMDEEIETAIPLEFVGESAAVREHGGILIKSLDSIEVKCLPADLPHVIEVDIAALKTFDDQIRIADIALPKGVEVVGETDTVIALVETPRTEAELASLDEKVEADVTKVEGVVKETPAAETESK